MEPAFDIALSDDAARLSSSVAAGVIYFIYLLVFLLRQNNLRIRWQDASRRSNERERHKGMDRFVSQFHVTHRLGTLLLVIVPILHTISYVIFSKMGLGFQPFFLLIIWGAFALMLPVCYFLFGLSPPEDHETWQMRKIAGSDFGEN